jgi:hypothetical protein
MQNHPRGCWLSSLELSPQIISYLKILDWHRSHTLVRNLMLPQLGGHVKAVPTVIASNEVSRITHLTEKERLKKDARSVLFEASGTIVILRG